MTLNNSKFAISLRAKIEQNKKLSLRKNRITSCLQKVHQELCTVISIINQITEDEEIYATIHVLRDFTTKYHKKWNAPEDEKDLLNTAFCKGYY